MPYSFADEPEDYRRPGTNQSQDAPDGTKMVQEFQLDNGRWDYLYVRVDEESSREEILREQENWEDALAGWNPPKDYRKAVWEILAYLEELLEARS